MDDSLRRELKQLEKRKLKARSAGDLAEEAKLYNVAGELLSEHRLFDRAIEEHQRELYLSEAIGDTIAIAISHRKLGECLCECRDFKNALFHQQKYLELSRKSHDLVEEQRAFATIGRTWFQSANSSSDMLKAQSAFLESLSICDQLREIVKEKELLEMRARLYLNLGLVYDNLKNKKKGMKYMEKALVIAMNQSLKDTEYRCHFSLGEIKLSDGHPAEALQCFERARKVAQHQKKKFDEADTLVQMGQALLNLGDFKGGKNILKKCLKSMRHGNHVKELRSSLIKAIKGTRLLEKLITCCEMDESFIKVFEDLGDLYIQVKCYQKAIHYYLKQLELSERFNKSNQEKAVICVSLAASYSDDQQYDKAKEYYHKELNLRHGDPDEQCDTWCNIAQVAEDSGDVYEDVEEAYRNALLCAKKAQKHSKQLRVLKLLAELQEKHSREVHLEHTLLEISRLEECKMEEDSEVVEEEEEKEVEEDNEEGERLIEEELEFSDNESDEDDAGRTSAGRVRRTNAKSIYKRNEKGETILHCAAIRGDYYLAKTSVEKGVSVHSRDYCGWQPLHEACNHGHVNIVELLLDNGADINDPGGPHCRGMTPLHDATMNGHVDVVKLLVARGACVSQKNKDGHTPLDQVLNAIADDEEDHDDSDPDLSQVRQELKSILRNAMASTKSRKTLLPEMRRRDQMDFLDESDDEQDSAAVMENNDISISVSTLSRKRKSVLSDLDSEDELSDLRKGPRISEKYDQLTRGNKKKIARVSRNHENALSGSESVLSDTKSLDQFSEESWKDANKLEVISSDASKSEVGTEILPDLSEDQCSGRAETDVLPEPYSQESFGSLNPLYPDEENDTFEAKSEETRFRLLPPRSKNTLWKSNSSLTTNRRDTILKNSGINFKTSVAFVDPVTGSATHEGRTSDSPALIPENDYLEGTTTANGWLIDDMPKKTSKRKRSSDIRNMLGSSAGQNTQKKLPQVANSRTHGAKKTNSNLRQSRLSNHVVSDRSPGNEPWNDDPLASVVPAGPTIRSGTSSAENKTMHAPTPMRLRVKVKDKVFLIPCSCANGEDKTVQWLAEQATFRYYTACGLKPVLSLSTAEGASLSPDDRITDVLSNNEQVIGSIENWDLPPLVERYKTACLSTDTEVHQYILETLQSDAQLASIEFAHMALTPPKLLPLFRALQCHDQLVKLSLPGNRVGDSGFQHLVSALPSLPNLAVLIVSCNAVTHKGLGHLASILNGDSRTSGMLTGLKELDISFNPVKDIAASSLAIILRSCSNLQKLNMQSCYLTESTFQQRSVVIEAIKGLTRLRQLSISHNVIMADGLRPLLNVLSSCPVEVLDISYTTRKYNSAFAKSLGEYLDTDNCCIQELSCQGCCLKDTDLAFVAQSRAFLRTVVKLDLSLNDIGREGAVDLAVAVQSSQCPKHLNLSGNVHINNESLLQFLAPSTAKNLQRLDLSVCGLSSPIPTELENLQELVFPKILKFLNLSHNSIHEQDLEKLCRWWNSVWGKRSHMCLDPPLSIFTINELKDLNYD